MARSVAIVIRATEASDAAAIQRMYNQRDVAAMTLQVPHQSLLEIGERTSSRADLRRLVAEIDGAVVGEGGLGLAARRRQHVGSIGMAVAAEFRRQGVGSALLEGLLDLADNWYGLRRVELDVYVDNVAAIRLYERHGFTIEGTHRDYAFRLGSYVDAHTMARIRPDERDRIDGAANAPYTGRDFVR